MDSTTATITAGALSPALAFLTQHPELPAPRGIDIGYAGGGLTVMAWLDTAEQAQVWGAAVGRTVGVSEYKGSTHYSVTTFEPFYITATAIVAPDEVSS